MSNPAAATKDFSTGRCGTLHELLDEKAENFPTDLAFRFLADGESDERLLTYGDLARKARASGKALSALGVYGQPVLLIRPPGLEFIEGLFACWYAGAIAIPAYPPRGGRHKKRLQAIIEDSQAKIALTTAGQEALEGIIPVLPAEDPVQLVNLKFPEIDPEAACLLQYTSGSTATPKGVMISHANFRGHFGSMLARQDLVFGSLMSWLPPYHDMGLVLKILYAFELGVPLTFFTPEHFIQRPAKWLRAISKYQTEMSGAPNFAYELCLRSIRDEELEGVDLSCWKSAASGAERIRAETLDRFAKRFAPWGFKPEALRPGYGLAEATLLVTGAPADEMARISTHPQSGKLVSNGPALPGIDLRIVDPVTGSECGDREIGEIRVKGPAVSKGYWKNPGATASTFTPEGELLTGDLGYLEDGHLYVSGRIKDLIIIDGTNHAPEDLESVILSGMASVTAAAAFPMDVGGRESVVMVVEAQKIPTELHAACCAEVRTIVGGKLEIPVKRVVIVRAGLIPRTTSGKMRRSACREALEAGSLPILFDDDSYVPETVPVVADGPLSILLELVAEVTGYQGASGGDDLVEIGLSSMDMTRLAALLQERTGAAISIGELFAAKSISEIAMMIPHHIQDEPTLPSVVPGSGDEADVMTHSQERMWFLHQLEPESAAYHVFGALELSGPINIAMMDRAVASVISRHDILCSRHGSENGRPRIWIEHGVTSAVEHHPAADEAGIQKCLVRFASRPFSLAGDSPIRTCIVSCGEKRHIFGICAHHIVADGWSMRILAREIADSYAAMLKGEPAALSVHRHGYLDYAVSHRRWVDSGAMDSQIEYWKKQLEGHSGVVQLASDFPRPPQPSSAGGAVELNLPEDLIDKISALAKTHRGTPFMVHLAAFLLLLRRHGAGDDPVVAIPVANRNHAAAVDLIGTLVNTLPFRLTMDPEETFAVLLERVREATFGMQAAQDAPFEKIIDAVKPDRARDHSPLAQVMFDHQEIPIAETWEGGLECRPYVAHRGAVQFDLSLLLPVLSDRQQISIEYREDLFLRETARAFLDRYIETLECVCREPVRPLASILCMTGTDVTRLAKISEGPVRPSFPRQTAPALITSRMALHPERLAVTAGTEALSFGDLDSRSGQLAAALRSRGVNPGDRVAILLERSIQLPVTLLAIWKAGAAYVPLDSSNPPDRLKLILEDQAPIHILAATHLTPCLPVEVPVILLEDLLGMHKPAVVSHVNTPSDPAYVIYTSGSTGKPKGVVISHGALANFLLSMAETPGFTEADRLLAVTTISFDISTLEIFLPLITGGNLDLVTTTMARDGRALLDRLQSTRATVMQATPATWRLLLDAGWKGSPDVKILCGGEALDLPLAKQLVPMGCQFWNMYGPTETTVWSTLWRVPADPEVIRIGSPIANTGVHVLAPDGSSLPPGVTGELWISGDGLAEGYWDRPELTSTRFVTSADGVRRYHTGDLARWASDGTLECLGRSDGQVKIRGFRVELGEIETAIAAHPKVAQAKVAFRGADAASKKVVAWISLEAGQTLPDMAELREFLAGQLPTYMLPADIGIIDAFPLGPSGKVDVSKLGNPESQVVSSAPLTTTEKKLGTIWRELLDKSTINREDDWFHSGGHSLLALRLFSRIRQDFHRTLPLSAILDHSTLKDLAAKIDHTAIDPASP